MKTSVWLRELRAPFFTGTIVPVVFGTVYAHHAGFPLNWWLFALTALGAVLAHAGVNMANDYFDHKSGDDYLTTATPVSGGSKVIQEGLLRPGQVLAASILCLSFAAAIGLYLNFVTGGRVILFVGMIGMVFGWFYTAPPLKLGHRSGLGELACVLGYGPVISFGAYFVQARQFSWSALVAGLPIGILMGLVLFINEFHDAAADRQVGKRTLVVTLGTQAAARVLAATLVLTYALAVLLVVVKILPPVALAVLVTVPLAWFSAARARRWHGESPRLLPANFAIIGLHLVFGMILIVTVMV